MSTIDNTHQKLNKLLLKMDKIQEEIGNIMLIPEGTRISNNRQLTKLKCEKLRLESKYFTIVKEELVDSETDERRFRKIINKKEDKRCKLTYEL